MKNWKSYLAKRIVVEEYYIAVPTQFDTFQFKVHYVRHNGYTLIQPLATVKDEYTEAGQAFMEWITLRSDFNTRYDQPHWWKPVRFFRKRKITTWAVQNIDKAYSAWKQELILTINNR